VHTALSGPQVGGVSARVTFTNRLIDGSGLSAGQDPVLTGASGRLWISAAGDVRLELQSDGGAGDAQAVLQGDHWWLYHAASNTVFRGTLPPDAHPAAATDPQAPPTLAQVQRAIERLAAHADLSGATPTDVAGRAAYSVRLGPRRDGGLVSGAELAFDAANGAPLRAAVYARGDASPVLQLVATDVSFGSVPASAFDIQPPKDAKVVELSPAKHAGAPGSHAAPVSGLAAVQAQVGFPVAAPATLAGMDRSGVRLIGTGGKAGALVTYGHGLGGIAVVQMPARAGDGAAAPAGRDGGALPTVDIGGTSATQLSTPLGTGLTFTRAGVRYVVLGSVTAATAQAAARGL